MASEGNGTAVATVNASCILGQAIQQTTEARIESFTALLNDNCKWLEEVLLEAKRAFATPTVELLPKTPSCKRARAKVKAQRMMRTRQSELRRQAEDEVAEMPVRPAQRNCMVRCGLNKRPKCDKDSGHVSGGTISDDNSPDEATTTSSSDNTSMNDDNNTANTPTDDNLPANGTCSPVSGDSVHVSGCMPIDVSQELVPAEQTPPPTTEQIADKVEAAAAPADKTVNKDRVAVKDKSEPFTRLLDSSATRTPAKTAVVIPCRVTPSTSHAARDPSLARTSPCPSPRTALTAFRLLSVMEKVHAMEACSSPVIHYGVSGQPPQTPPKPIQQEKKERRRSSVRRSRGSSVRGRPSMSASKLRRSSVYRQQLNRGGPIATAAVAQLAASAAAPEARCTRSKLRLKKVTPPTLTPPSSDVPPSKPPRGGDAAVTATIAPSSPAGRTRSKMRLNKQAPEQLPTDDRAMMTSTSGKRAQLSDEQQNDDVTPPKRHCLDPVSQAMSKMSVRTPSPKIHAKKNSMLMSGARSRVTPTHQSSRTVLSQSQLLNRTRTTPTHQSTAAFSSFMRRNTPKTVSQKETIEQKRKELAAKERHDETRMQKRQELLQKRAEDQRKRREERQRLAEQRRLEKEKREQEVKLSMAVRNQEKQAISTRALAEKLRDDREKRGQREKKIAEAEQKRRERSGIRHQKLAALEEEQRHHEEQLSRRREAEEMERQQHIAELRRHAGERQAETERERQLAADRLRVMADARQREEADRQRVKDEREKQARLEREKQELERQRERERAREEDIARQREMIRQKLEERRAQEKIAAEQKRIALQLIDKHNHALQQNSSLNSSSCSTSAAAAQLQRSHLLNTTATKEVPALSYAMTPPVKPYKPRSSENYDITDVHSDDSTDDECSPRKPIPTWAAGQPLRAALVSQHHHPPNLDEIFTIITPPDLNNMFVKRKPRFNKRTSSAVWHSPIFKPSSHY